MFESLKQIPRQLTLGLTFPLIFLNGWLLLLLAQQLQPLVSILIAATLIAFLLDYPIRFLQDRGIKRSFAGAFVLLLFLLLLATLLLFLVPVIWQQANELVVRLPEWLKSGKEQLQALQVWATEQQFPLILSTYLNQLIERLTNLFRSLTGQLINFLLSAIGSIVNIFLTLVFSIFLVLRGDRLWNGILSWFPPQWSSQVRESLPRNFERYIAGQVTMASILAVAQSANLTILQVPLAQLFGSAIGAASLIPFGGTITIIIISLLLALENFWLGVKVLVVAIIVNQVIENVLAPRIVGELTGLNPVWMLISLDIGVKLGGALGLIVAVPIASFIKVSFDTIRASNGTKPIALVEVEKSSTQEEKIQPTELSPSKLPG